MNLSALSHDHMTWFSVVRTVGSPQLERDNLWAAHLKPSYNPSPFDDVRPFQTFSSCTAAVSLLAARPPTSWCISQDAPVKVRTKDGVFPGVLCYFFFFLKKERREKLGSSGQSDAT